MPEHDIYLLFHAANRRYALAVSDVLRVVPAAETTPVRNMPPLVQGVINVAGEILPVIDIRVHEGGKVETIEPSDRFILTRAAGPPLALLVNGVDGVEELEEIPVSLPMDAVASRETDTPCPSRKSEDQGSTEVSGHAPENGADHVSGQDDRPGTAVVATMDGEIVLIRNIRHFVAAIAAMLPPHPTSDAIPDPTSVVAKDSLEGETMPEPEPIIETLP
ncbi:CheW-like domain-containing protein [Desulfonatronum zhilinae]|nr:CheW-like domain-containing protein [Desulfonatronum zhilinae]